MQSHIFHAFVVILFFFPSPAEAESISIISQSDIAKIGVQEEFPLDGSYILEFEGSELELTPTLNISYISSGIFTGTFNGNSKKLSGLNKPLFNDIGGDIETIVTDLTLQTTYELVGQGVLANFAGVNTLIDGVHAEGYVNGNSFPIDVGGLVGGTAGGVTIQNSSFAGTVDSSADYVGGLVGASSAAISNSTSSGAVNGLNNVGGLVGFSTGTISNSTSYSEITGFTSVGGLVGKNVEMVVNSYAFGDVDGSIDVGGLVGSQAADISNSEATGNVSGVSNVGGLVGSSSFQITDSSANGSVTGFAKVGGLVGESIDAIVNSSAIGNVHGQTYVGGLVGYVDSGSITKSFANGAVFGDEGVGGLAGYVDSGDVTESFATGSVSGDSQYAGGLVGLLEGGNVDSSYATGFITGIGEVGGLIGRAYSSLIYSSYSNGSVSGENNTGGLIGSAENVSISNSYSLGVVQGILSTGGLVGSSTYSTISNSYVSIFGDLIGFDNYLGGLVGQTWWDEIVNSFVDLRGNLESSSSYVGGLVGYLQHSNISNSAVRIDGTISASGDYVGGITGYFFGFTPNGINEVSAKIFGDILGSSDIGSIKGMIGGDPEENVIDSACAQIGSNPINGIGCELLEIPTLPSILQVIDNSRNYFTVSSCLNNNFPYLIVLEDSYSNACTTISRPDFRLSSFIQLTTKRLTQPKIPTYLIINSVVNEEIPELQFVDPLAQTQVTFAEVSVIDNSRLDIKPSENFQLMLQKSYFNDLQVWITTFNGKPIRLTSIDSLESGEAILPAFNILAEGTYTLLFLDGNLVVNENFNANATIGKLTLVVGNN